MARISRPSPKNGMQLARQSVTCLATRRARPAPFFRAAGAGRHAALRIM